MQQGKASWAGPVYAAVLATRSELEGAPLASGPPGHVPLPASCARESTLEFRMETAQPHVAILSVGSVNRCRAA